MMLLWILENDPHPHPIIVSGTDGSSCWEKICPRGNAQYLSAKWQETSQFIDLLRVCLFACLSYLLIQPSDILYWRVWLFPVRFKTSLYARDKKKKMKALYICKKSIFPQASWEKINNKDDVQYIKYGSCAWTYTHTCISGTCIAICFSILNIIWLKFSIVLYRYSLFSLATIPCPVNKVCVCVCVIFKLYIIK